MLRGMRLACVALGLLVGACGARSSLVTGDENETDGGTPPTDMPLADGGSPDMGPVVDFEADCPPPVETRPGFRASVSAAVTGDFTPGELRWSFFAGPEPVSPMPATGTMTAILPPVTGIYELQFTATDASGVSDSCIARIVATGSLPLLVCPDVETVPVGDSIELLASAFDEEGPVALEWRLLDGPGMASLEPTGPETALFTGFIAGEYRIEVVGTDTDGNTTSCSHVIRVIAPPEIDCPGEPFRGPTRQELDIALTVRDDTRVVDHRWEPLTWPSDDTGIEIVREDGSNLTMVPRRRGEYTLRYTATDTDGLSSSCVVTAIGVPTPPTLTCPMEVITRPLTDTTIEAMAEDDGMLSNWQWDLVSQPMGSAAMQPSPRNAPSTVFRADIAGRYELSVRVRDDDGNEASCMTTVIAVVDEGLRVEMFWDSDGTDMDTHLLSPRATAWTGDEDCHFRNCIGGGLSWGPRGAEDDPRLDIDEQDGFGPENINIDEPENGTFRVGIHGWRGRGDVTVRIYCGGDRMDPEVTLGPTRVTDGDLWKVADVTIDGIDCSIDELTNAAGQPLVINRPGQFDSR
jgi:hypothetical protein